MSNLNYGSDGKTVNLFGETEVVPADLVAKLAGVQLALSCKVIAALNALSATVPLAELVDPDSLPTTKPGPERRALAEKAYNELLDCDHEDLQERLDTLGWVNENIKRSLGKK